MHNERRYLSDMSDVEVAIAVDVLETIVREPVYRGVPEDGTVEQTVRELDYQRAQYDLFLKLRAESQRRKEASNDGNLRSP